MTEIAGRYTLEAEIGRGGMGAVWRGRDEVLGRTVALKRIGVAPGGITPDAIRAEREAKLAAKLNHANVVAVYDLVEQVTPDGLSQQWLVMENVEGTDLAELIRTRGRLTPDEAAPILAQVASALAAAHGAGIVHRDVKPSNILVAPDGQVKLSDFGIARTAADPSLTQTGLVTGSPAYMSPEVASGQQATPASDVWSWGASLFHALEGQPPYQINDNLLGALYRIVHEEPPRAGAAGWLAPVLAATMTRDVEQRWPMTRVHEFLEGGPDTQPALASVGGLADIGFAAPARTRSYDDGGSTQVLPLSSTTTAPPPPPATPGEDPGPEPPSRRWAIVVGAAVAVVVAMVIAFAIGLHDGNGGDDDRSGPSTGTSSPSNGGQTTTADEPTEDGMTSFIRDYIDTAVSDPASAFKMLTPEFQDQSKGLTGYEEFWGEVRNAKILSVSADPQSLEVAYRYRYVRPGGPTTEDVTLQLAYEDGTYLIAGEG
jgi:eukaryotic-like serine/threonine-protein kinase